MKMPQPLETITVTTPTLFCDGADVIGGHPRVFLTMKTDGTVDCPYCGRHFVLDAHAKADSHH